METDLFSWEHYDDMDDMAYMYYGCVLKVRIGDFEPGHKMPSIYVVFGKKSLWLYDENNKEIGPFELELTIKK